ncbi:hypothetical protein E3N88_10226 [Mikania micrantha]|uniref:Uncharacterized protein n=1 Tax=Mikania micrantha TaxID=192012 RepID=A0A5N6PA24_9ASTR|nr:hypothetical protein E3N88_10226 [Mikania micrantha]
MVSWMCLAATQPNEHEQMQSADHVCEALLEKRWTKSLQEEVLRVFVFQKPLQTNNPLLITQPHRSPSPPIDHHHLRAQPHRSPSPPIICSTPSSSTTVEPSDRPPPSPSRRNPNLQSNEGTLQSRTLTCNRTKEPSVVRRDGGGAGRRRRRNPRWVRSKESSMGYGRRKPRWVGSKGWRWSRAATAKEPSVGTVEGILDGVRSKEASVGRVEGMAVEQGGEGSGGGAGRRRRGRWSRGRRRRQWRWRSSVEVASDGGVNEEKRLEEVRRAWSMSAPRRGRADLF